MQCFCCLSHTNFYIYFNSQENSYLKDEILHEYGGGTVKHEEGYKMVLDGSVIWLWSLKCSRVLSLGLVLDSKTTNKKRFSIIFLSPYSPLINGKKIMYSSSKPF